MKKLYLGIDPGKSGGLAVLSEDNKVMDVFAMPLAGNNVDFQFIADWLNDYLVDNSVKFVGCIEKVHAFPDQGVVSMFKFGFVTGGVHGVLAALNIPRHLVTPHQWKKAVLIGMDRSDKNSAVQLCRRIYPNENLLKTEKSRVPHSGMADALCIARYALLKEL